MPAPTSRPSPELGDGGLPFSIRAVPLEPRRVRVEVLGEIDIATSPQLNAGLLRELMAGRDVELDLTGVAFMDASALGAIIGARRRFERREQSLLVCLRSASQPHRLLTLTGILPMLALADGRPPADPD